MSCLFIVTFVVCMTLLMSKLKKNIHSIILYNIIMHSVYTVYMYMCVCVCVYIYICIHTHTHTHIYIYIYIYGKIFLRNEKELMKE